MTCPYCGSVQRGFRTSGGEFRAEPSENDSIVCGWCGRVSVWHAGRLWTASDDERREQLANPQLVFLEAEEMFKRDPAMQALFATTRWPDMSGGAR